MKAQNIVQANSLWYAGKDFSVVPRWLKYCRLALRNFQIKGS